MEVSQDGDRAEAHPEKFDEGYGSLAECFSIYLEISTDNPNALELNFNAVQSEGPVAGVHPSVAEGVIRARPRCLHIGRENLMA
jgi:hypothetical protein